MKFKPYILLTITILIISACYSLKLKSSIEKFNETPILNDTSKSYIYRTEIKLYDNEFSGITVLRPQSNSYRIIFLNEIGMKFFDFELFSDSFQIKQIFNALNKKMFLRLLISDFRLILNYPQNKEVESFINKQTREVIINPNQTGDFIYISKTGLPYKKIRRSLYKQTTELVYSDYMEQVPRKIKIEHYNINFMMQMNFLK